MVKKLLCIGFITLFLFCAIGVVKVFAESTKKVPTINFGYLLNQHSAPVMVAAAEWKAFKKKYNIYLKPIKEREVYELYDGNEKVAIVKFISAKKGPDLQILMSNGSVDMGITGTQALILSVDRGLEAKIISPLQTEGNVFVVRKEFHYNTWDEFVKDVKGRGKQFKIGHPGVETIASIIFRNALSHLNITFTDDPSDKSADILFIDMKGHANLAMAMSSGIVDGLIGAMPYPAVVIKKGFAKQVALLKDLPPKNKWLNHACCSVVVTDKAAKEKESAIVKMTELLILAERHINNNKQELAKTCALWLGIEQDIAEMSMSSIHYTTAPDKGWINSVHTFVDVMDEMEKYGGRLKDKKGDELDSLLFNFGIYKKAVNGLKAKKL